MKWYEHITGARWFKRVDSPRTRVGHIIITTTALGFAVVAFLQNPSPSHSCSTNPLRGVYNPKRLQVLATCQQINVTVYHVSKERDGDLHIQAAADPKWLAAGNNRQHHDLVVEYMPGDPYPRPRPGDKLSLNCTWVKDLQHGGRINGWTECHPVWSVQPLGQAAGKVEP